MFSAAAPMTRNGIADSLDLAKISGDLRSSKKLRPVP